MPHRILVTGATGTVGREVVAQLRQAGTAVRALTRGRADLLPGVETVRGDLSVPGSLHSAVQNVTAVFLVWPFTSADGLAAVLGLIAEHARKLVYLSSVAVRDHERQAEQLIDESGLDWTVLRPHAFAANTLRWSEQIRSAGVVREAYGQASMSLIHERDIAAVAMRALMEDGHTGARYELTGPQPLTQTDQLRLIGEATKRPLRWEEATPQEARQKMLIRGWPPEVAADILQAQAAMATGPAPTTTTVHEVTGTRPHSFQTWAEENKKAFRPAP